MSTLNDTDLLLVNRGGQSYNVEYQNMPTLQDTDLLLVNRGGQSYKIEAKDLEKPEPPSIDYVFLVENDPEGDRFTSQSFTASSSIVNGSPNSTKYIDAYVDGSITSTGQFQAPLVATSSTTGPNWTNDGTWEDVGTGVSANNRNYMFNGNQSQAPSTNSNVSGGSTWGQKYTPPAGQWTNVNKFEIMFSGSGNSSSVYSVTGTNGYVTWFSYDGPGVWIDVTEQIVDPDTGEAAYFQYGGTAQTTTQFYYPSGIRVNGIWLIDNQDLLQLQFDASTDMVYLAPGDEVSQGDGGPPLPSGITYSDFISAPQGSTGSSPTIIFNGETGNMYEAAVNGTIVWATSTFPLNGHLEIYNNSPTVSPNNPVMNITDDTGTRQVAADGTENHGGNGYYIDCGTVTNMTQLLVTGVGGSNTARLYAIKLNGTVMVDGQGVPGSGASGTVSTIDGTNVAVGAVNTTDWENGANVTGPEKTMVIDNTRRYLEFDSSGNVSTLLTSPQDPPYSTPSSNPSLTLTFPATFPSGDTPDETLGVGTTLTVSYTAENNISTAGPVTATVQPEPSGPSVDTTGLTTLWNGSGNTPRAIINGIDLAANGGLVWIKNAGGAASENHQLFDTTRGNQVVIYSNTNDGDQATTDRLLSFNDNGFTVGNRNEVNGDPSGNWIYVGWTFEQAPGYFDIVSFTGTGATSQQIPHNLGSVPGCIFLKNLNQADWAVYHKDVGNTRRMILNSNAAQSDENSGWWANTDPTDQVFSVGNVTGGAIASIAYLFADTPDLIKCGSYTGSGDNSPTLVEVGFQPQWVLIKAINSAATWSIFDAKRDSNRVLFPNDTQQEQYGGPVTYSASGFTVNSGDAAINGAQDYLYVTIAAPPDTVSMTQEQFAAFNTSMDEYPMKECVGHLQMEMARTGTTIWEIAARLADDDYDD